MMVLYARNIYEYENLQFCFDEFKKGRILENEFEKFEFFIS